MKKSWFTLAETLIVCSMFAFVVIWIIFAINKAFAFLDNTRLLVRATNFAREWVEMVYNIRDTNRKKYSWDKDSHRTENWTWWTISEWLYAIKEWKYANGDSYFYTQKLNDVSGVNPYEIEWFFNIAYENERKKTEIVFTGTYSYFSWWTLNTWWNISELLQVDWLTFYRVLKVYGIYCKGGQSAPSPNQLVDASHCSNKSDPKEMRFCVKIFYDVNGWKHATELCSLMTNFEE